jgi:hypothetical protein
MLMVAFLHLLSANMVLQPKINVVACPQNRENYAPNTEKALNMKDFGYMIK